MIKSTTYQFFVWLDPNSEDINKQVHAMFACPKSLRPRMKKYEAIVAKRSIAELVSDEEDSDELSSIW